MKYEQIRMQFEEICTIVEKIYENNNENDLTLYNDHAKFIEKFSEIVGNYDKFIKLMEISAMSAKEIFVVVLAFTGCEVKQLTKPMTRELRKALKSREIK